MDKKIYSTSEVIEKLGISRRTLYRHVKKGKLKVQQPGGQDYMIPRSALIDYLGEDLFRELFGEK